MMKKETIETNQNKMNSHHATVQYYNRIRFASRWTDVFQVLCYHTCTIVPGINKNI